MEFRLKLDSVIDPFEVRSMKSWPFAELKAIYCKPSKDTMGILELAIVVVVVKLDRNEADVLGPCSWSTYSVLGMGVEGNDAAKLSNG